MPIIASAKKKMRQDQKRFLSNKRVQNLLKQAIKTARQKPTPKNISRAYACLDTAAKKHLIHPNKASRLKSGLTINKLKA